MRGAGRGFLGVVSRRVLWMVVELVGGVMGDGCGGVVGRGL